MEEIKYPENLIYQQKIAESGKTITFLAKKLKISRETLSRMINGKYKGENIKPVLNRELNIETSND